MIDSNKKQTLIIVGVVAAILGFASKLAYRPWVINNHVDDYGIQGFSPSFFYTVGACLLMAGFSNKNYIKNMLWTAAGATVYEVEQYYTSMIFDYKDLLATGVGLGMAILIGKIVFRKKKEEVEALLHEES